jgi:excisionase family DNA binding protein
MSINTSETLLLRAHEVADILRISRATTYAWMANGTLPTVRIGVCGKRVPRAALLEWLETRTTRPAVLA